MMKTCVVALCLMCALSSVITAQTADRKQDLNRPIPMAARRLAIRGTELVDQDAVRDGVVLLKRAISLAPNYIWAHQQYFAARAYHQGEYDAVRAEYDRLMAREPNNPIYPLVIAETSRAPSDYVRPLFEKVVKLAPDWAWAYYARAILGSSENKTVTEEDQATKELKVTELRKCVEYDETAGTAYYTLAYILEKGLGRIDQAMSVYENLAAQPEFKLAGLRQLWSLRLNKEQGNAEAKARLRTELARRAAMSRDVAMLAVVRDAYLDLLNDSAAADQVEKQIRRLDARWYPERGKTLFIAATTEAGISRPLLIANRQFFVFQQVEQIDELEPKEKIARLKKFLSPSLGREMKIYIYQRILRASEKIKDRSSFVKYGEALLALEPDNTGLRAKIAIALADQKTDLKKAFGYATLAERATSKLRPIQRPRNTPPEWFAWAFPDTRWRDNYKRQRALALDAAGWVLYQMGDYVRAEEKLRQSCAIVRGERNLSHLSESLRKLGRTEEAESAARDSNNVWLESLKRQFVDQPSFDFQLEGIAGQKYRLSEFKGKVVLLDFWATWCGPCVEEMPHLVELYRKYRDRGFVVLAISADYKSDRYKVAPFAETHKLIFPVLFDEGISALYKVKGYPTTIFIDREGHVRYVDSGFNADRPRALDAVVKELLK
jgi:thiol-disulfide isomerase/thioredoxin